MMDLNKSKNRALLIFPALAVYMILMVLLIIYHNTIWGQYIAWAYWTVAMYICVVAMIIYRYNYKNKNYL